MSTGAICNCGHYVTMHKDTDDSSACTQCECLSVCRFGQPEVSKQLGTIINAITKVRERTTEAEKEADHHVLSFIAGDIKRIDVDQLRVLRKCLKSWRGEVADKDVAIADLKEKLAAWEAANPNEKVERVVTLNDYDTIGGLLPPSIKVGDYVLGTVPGNLGVIRRITEVRDSGYTWVYLHGLGEDFISENSNDPFFEHGWHVIRHEFAETPEVAPILAVIEALLSIPPTT